MNQTRRQPETFSQGQRSLSTRALISLDTSERASNGMHGIPRNVFCDGSLVPWHVRAHSIDTSLRNDRNAQARWSRRRSREKNSVGVIAIRGNHGRAKQRASRKPMI